MVGTTGGGAQRQQVLGVRRSPEGGQGGAQREQVLGVRRSPEGGQGGWGGNTHCGPPRGRPGWCCPPRCGQCSCSHRCRPCSGPVAGGICPPRGTGCGHLPGEIPPGWQTLMSVSQPPGRQGHGTSGTGPQPLHLCPAEDSLGKQAPLGGKGILPGALPLGLLQGAHAQSRSWSLPQIYNP